jgi:hypothetical protein
VTVLGLSSLLLDWFIGSPGALTFCVARVVRSVVRPARAGKRA